MNKTLYLLSLMLLAALISGAQTPVQPGSSIQPPPLVQVLNGGGGAAPTFASLQKKITIVDFFGTWCIPCLRALPKLAELQKAFPDQLAVVLISNEEEAPLKKFLSARPNFSFPIVVDKNGAWNALFQPPALPYTAILDEKGTVLALTEAKDLTAEKIRGWLGGAPPAAPGPRTPTTVSTPSSTPLSRGSSNAAVRLSEKYLYAARTGDSLQPWKAALKGLTYDALVGALKTDNEKKAFWINLYNGYTQATLSAAPDKYRSRNAFFKEKGIQVGGMRLSLDDIEHGILRRSRIKWSMGYLGNPFASSRIKGLQVADIDYRIHFALNCGAESCPPIAFYTDAALNEQLETATRSYLQGEAKWDSAANTVHLPKLMSWFRADFGGKRGSLQLLKKLGLIPADAAPSINYLPYDWTLSLNKYKTENQ